MSKDRHDDSSRIDLTPEPQSPLASPQQSSSAGETLELKVEQLEERIAPTTISQSTGAGAGKVTFNP